MNTALNDLEFAGSLFLDHMPKDAIWTHRRSLLSMKNRPAVFKDVFIVNGVPRTVEIPMQDWLIALDFMILSKE